MKKLILVLAILALICPFMGMKLYLTNTSSSGQTQSDPNASLGGYRSTTELSATSMKNLFDDVSVVEALLGDTEYRMIDVYNDGTGTAYGVQLYMQTATSSSSTELDFGYSSTNQPHADAWNGEALSNESTAPASPSMSFSNYTKTSPLSLGTIPASQSKRVCVRRTVTAGAPWTAHDLGRFGVRWGGVAAPEATSYSDAFTGDDGTHLYDHDNNWTLATGVSVDDAAIGSNAARANAWRSPCLFYDASSSDISQATIRADINSSAWAGVCVRASSGYNGYCAALVNPSGGNWTACNVYKNGSYIGASGGTWAVASTHTIKIQASGTTTVTIKTWVDGVAMTDQTDSTSTITSGHPAIFLRNESVGSASIMLDDWSDN